MSFNTPTGLWRQVRSRNGLTLMAFLAIVGFYLVTEHTAHLYSVLPYLLFLLCPVMHLFMHGGHGNHAAHHGTGAHAAHENHSTESGA
jgi:hypothetical protein